MLDKRYKRPLIWHKVIYCYIGSAVLFVFVEKKWTTTGWLLNWKKFQFRPFLDSVIYYILCVFYKNLSSTMYRICLRVVLVLLFAFNCPFSIAPLMALAWDSDLVEGAAPCCSHKIRHHRGNKNISNFLPCTYFLRVSSYNSLSYNFVCIFVNGTRLTKKMWISYPQVTE